MGWIEFLQTLLWLEWTSRTNSVRIKSIKTGGHSAGSLGGADTVAGGSDSELVSDAVCSSSPVTPGDDGCTGPVLFVPPEATGLPAPVFDGPGSVHLRWLTGWSPSCSW